MMKKSTLLALSALLVAVLLGSCGEKKKPTLKEMEEEFILQPTTRLSAADTSAVMSLMETFLTTLRDEDYEQATSMLYHVDSAARLVPLTAEEVQSQSRVLRNNRGVRYELESVVFHNDLDNQARIRVTLFEKKAGDPTPNEVSYIVRPVRIGEEWYLTMADTSRQPRESKIRN